MSCLGGKGNILVINKFPVNFLLLEKIMKIIGKLWIQYFDRNSIVVKTNEHKIVCGYKTLFCIQV